MKVIDEKFYTSFVQSLQNLVCIFPLRGVSIWANHISGAQQPHGLAMTILDSADLSDTDILTQDLKLRNH